MTILALNMTTPTLLSDRLREMAVEAERMAVDPVNALDDNPFIGREWVIVAGELRAAAQRMDVRFEMLFGSR